MRWSQPYHYALGLIEPVALVGLKWRVFKVNGQDTHNSMGRGLSDYNLANSHERATNKLLFSGFVLLRLIIFLLFVLLLETHHVYTLQ